MPEIKVTKPGGFKYGVGDARRQYGKGDTIVAKQKDARLLVAAKLAEYVDETQGKAKAAAPAKTRATRTTRMAAAPKTAAGKKGTVSASSRYDRRDMRAK